MARLRRFPLSFRCGLGLLLAVLLGGCAPSPRGGADPAADPAPVWPAPPDPPRFVFETRLVSPSDVLGRNPQESLRRRLTGDTTLDRPAFEKIGAVVARHGRIYVADTVQKRIVVFDVPRRRLFHFGLRPPGQLQKPVAMAMDAAQNVYVADAGLRQVLVYDGFGLHLRSLGSPGELARPTGVAVRADGERIYVVDRATNDSDRHRVVIFDRDGRKLAEIGRRGEAAGEFNIPVQAAVSPQGELYVLDAGNFRVQVFAADGRFLRAFGSSGTGVGNFSRPRGLAVDASGLVYVSDGFFGNFQIFTAEGQLLLAVGSHGNRDAPGRYGLISGLAVDETGRVYVADQLFNKIEVIRPTSPGGKDQARQTNQGG